MGLSSEVAGHVRVFVDVSGGFVARCLFGVVGVERSCTHVDTRARERTCSVMHALSSKYTTGTWSTKKQCCYTLVQCCYTLVQCCYTLVQCCYTLVQCCYTLVQCCYTLVQCCYTLVQCCYTLVQCCYTLVQCCYTLVQ